MFSLNLSFYKVPEYTGHIWIFSFLVTDAYKMIRTTELLKQQGTIMLLRESFRAELFWPIYYKIPKTYRNWYKSILLLLKTYKYKF